MYARSALIFAVMLTSSLFAQSSCDHSGSMTLTRAARDWQFLDAVGPHAGLLGREDGIFEAWIYPLKLFRDFQLKFRLGDIVLTGRHCCRAPSPCGRNPSSVKYIYDSFTACATWFVPVDQRARSSRSKSIASIRSPWRHLLFPTWPGCGPPDWATPTVSGTRNSRRSVSAATTTASSPLPERREPARITTTYSANYSAEHTDVISFGPPAKGNTTYRFVDGRLVRKPEAGRRPVQQAAHQRYRAATTRPRLLLALSRQHREALAAGPRSCNSPTTGRASAPCRAWWTNPSRAKAWSPDTTSRAAAIARASAGTSVATPCGPSLALNSIGDFRTTRTALEFLMQYQRPDGKIPHEIAQTVKLIDWWKDYPYGTASADGTPLFIVGFDDYVRASGDVAFARDHWDSLWRRLSVSEVHLRGERPGAEPPCRAWLDRGRPAALRSRTSNPAPPKANSQASYIRRESALPESSRSPISRAPSASPTLLRLSITRPPQQRATIEKLFWSPQSNSYGYALDVSRQAHRQAQRARHGAHVVRRSSISTRAISSSTRSPALRIRPTGACASSLSKDPLYSPTGYHFGSVWPLFTGWASVAGYRYHRALYGYLNLMANAQLAHDGSPGRVTEVLSGDYYTQLSTSTPHQIWSSAMVISPLLRGLMGLEVDAMNSRVTFAPHVPAGWNDFAIQNVKVGTTRLDFTYHRTADDITLEVAAPRQRQRTTGVFSGIQPARESSRGQGEWREGFAEDVAANENDQHATVSVPISADKTTIHLHVSGDFGIAYPFAVPARWGAPAQI